MHYYAIVDASKNDFNSLLNNYQENFTISGGDNSLENVFCDQIKSGFLFHSGNYDSEDGVLRQQKNFFKMNCRLIDFGNG